MTQRITINTRFYRKTSNKDSKNSRFLRFAFGDEIIVQRSVMVPVIIDHFKLITSYKLQSFY